MLFFALGHGWLMVLSQATTLGVIIKLLKERSRTEAHCTPVVSWDYHVIRDLSLFHRRFRAVIVSPYCRFVHLQPWIWSREKSPGMWIAKINEFTICQDSLFHHISPHVSIDFYSMLCALLVLQVLPTGQFGASGSLQQLPVRKRGARCATRSGVTTR